MVRRAAVAGQFYANRAAALRSEVERCFLSPIGPGHLPNLNLSGERRIVGAMVPHAGLVYSGPVAAHAYAALAEDGFPETFIIIGPNHHGRGKGVAVSDEDFETPLGISKVDHEIVSRLKGVVEVDRSAHLHEHSLEVQLPFIQYIKPDTKIVAIAMGYQDPETAAEVARSVRKAIESNDVVVLASSDMSHYVPAQVAKVKDMAVLTRLVDLDHEGAYHQVMELDVSMCGYGPALAMVQAVDGKGARLLKYASSGDVTPMRDVVGYASLIVTR
jgi:AmmeMemoRadiSam system protein B